MMTNRSNNIRFVFFGTAPLAVAVLNELEREGYVPALVVASADTTKPRTKEVVFPPEKVWALARSIEIIQPEKIDDSFISKLEAASWQLFIVASYGKILPMAVLSIPKGGVLNVHPSLLPRLRGPSPIRSAILNDEKETGVSVMLMDEQISDGEWPPHGKDLDESLAREGGKLLAEVLPTWIDGKIDPRQQDHTKATYTKMFTKQDGWLDLYEDPYENLLKIRAFEGWPGTFTLFERDGKRMRVAIIDAHMEGSSLVIDRVKPEGKTEMPYADFVRSGARLTH